MGGLESLVAEPQRDGRHVDAGLEQVHRGGVADDMRRHALGVQARTSLANSPAGLIEQMGDALEARGLVALRDRWLNPPEWVEWVDEPVPGYPKRTIPRDEDAGLN